MEQDRIVELIKNAGTDAFFVGGANDDQVVEIEKQLNIQLPNSYKWFLKNYGHGSLSGVFIIGVGKDKSLVCVKETERRRDLGLPNKFLVIENCDEWQFCLDTGNMKDGECPIVEWEKGVTGKRIFQNFYKYIIQRFSESLENMGRFDFLKEYIFEDPKDKDIWNNKNVFFRLNHNDIHDYESKLGRKFPRELKDFFVEVGYGFLRCDVNDYINRIDLK